MLAPMATTPQDAQKGQTSHPPNPDAPRRVLAQARPQRAPNDSSSKLARRYSPRMARLSPPLRASNEGLREAARCASTEGSVGPSLPLLADFFSILLKTVEGKCKGKLNELFDRQRLCTASLDNIESLQCLVKRMRCVPFVSQGIDERLSPMRESCLHECAKRGFFLVVEPRAVFRAQQDHCRADIRPGAKALG
jgi:hypothetical protein